MMVISKRAFSSKPGKCPGHSRSTVLPALGRDKGTQLPHQAWQQQQSWSAAGQQGLPGHPSLWDQVPHLQVDRVTSSQFPTLLYKLRPTVLQLRFKMNFRLHSSCTLVPALLLINHSLLPLAPHIVSVYSHIFTPPV